MDNEILGRLDERIKALTEKVDDVRETQARNAKELERETDALRAHVESELAVMKTDVEKRFVTKSSYRPIEISFFALLASLCSAAVAFLSKKFSGPS